MGSGNMYYNDNQCNETVCTRRSCRFSCLGIILAILTFFAALGIGAIIGVSFFETIMTAMAAIVVFVVIIAILIAILLIYRFCNCRGTDSNCD